MENFKQIAEDCLAGKLSGTFVIDKGKNWHSSYLQKYAICGHEMPGQYVLEPGVIYNEIGECIGRERTKIIDFIPDNMQKKIEIDIPEGKVPVMEQTVNGVVITWKEKELTYDDVLKELQKSSSVVNYFTHNSLSNAFYKKGHILSKLINIRNYFGNPSKSSKCGWVVGKDGSVYASMVEYPHFPVFAEKEHAAQAIKMLGDELKYLFEPW